MEEKKKRGAPRIYLRIEDFNNWKGHEFRDVVKAVWRIQGMLYVAIPLLIAILGIIAWLITLIV